MILAQEQNTAVTAPQLTDVESALAAYRSFRGFAWLTLNDLFQFITVPSAQRTEFLATLNQSVTLVRSDYAIKNYS